MESVGQQLRAARLRLGLTLEDISAKCRIGSRTLKAIEGDELDSFSSPFFYKSFVRQFAERVDIEYRDIEPALQVQANTLPEAKIPGRGDGYAPGMPALPAARPRRFRWIVSFASLAGVVIAGSGVYDFWQNSGAAWHDSMARLLQVDRAAQKVEVANASLPERTPPAEPAAVAGPKVEPETEAAAAERPEYRVELSALERTWLSIIADGRQIFKGVLETDDKKVLEGRRIARIYARNIGAISFVFNGRPIGTLGENGKVRTVVFTKDNYRILDAPAHISLTSFTVNAE